MKTIYVLTCVNENSDVVSVQLFDTKADAKAQMQTEFDNEKRDAEASGFDIDDYFSGVEDTTAGILYGDSQYKWKITSSAYESKDDAERRMKEEFIEQMYFDLKSTADGDKEVCNLNENVGDYDGFYLDRGSETIYVWNAVKRNYTSIFDIDTDDAYEIAKRIWNGEYSQDEQV